MFCTRCGAETAPGAAFCIRCGVPIHGPPAAAVAAPGDDPAMRLLLPVGRSGLAIVAGYLGLFSILIIPAPIALVVGLVALYDLRRRPGKHGRGRALFAIAAGALGTGLLLYELIRR